MANANRAHEHGKQVAPWWHEGKAQRTKCARSHVIPIPWAWLCLLSDVIDGRHEK